MRPKFDEDNVEITRILEELLLEGVTISAHEVIRKLEGRLANVSAISRNETRRDLVERYKTRQREEREKASLEEAALNGQKEPQPNSFSAGNLAVRLTAALAEVERQQVIIKALVTSHYACVQAVYATASGAGLRKFFADYQRIEKTLIDVGALPPAADVVVLPPRPGVAR